MKLSEIITKFVNQQEKKERQTGRYYASEIYDIIKGRITPENFFEEKSLIDEFGAKCISSGIASEEYLDKVFKEMNIDYTYQPKKEIQITEEVVLVVKPDFQFSDFIVEVKNPVKIYETIPEKWIYQLECEYRAFYLPVYLWQISHPFSVKQTAFVPSKQRWNKIIETLLEFHQKLKVLNQKRSL